MELLTSSRLRAFRACARQHYHAFVEGYRPAREADALAFGQAIHKALATWWTSHPSTALAQALTHLPATMDPYVRARAEVMLSGYDVVWREQGFEALEVEREFRLPLINPETGHPSRTWQLAGKVDGIVRGPDGRVWVLEHKTTSEDVSPGSPYHRRLAIDGQVSQYVEGAAALGYDVAGVLYDVLCKPALRPLQANTRRKEPESPAEYRDRLFAAVCEAPHRYFATFEVVRLEQERDEWRWDVWQLAEQMRTSARTGRAPRNPDACFRYGTACPFFDVCTGVADLSDPYRFVQAGATPELQTHAA
jgi:hypothetical protein